jgi:hypothetical protein
MLKYFLKKIKFNHWIIIHDILVDSRGVLSTNTNKICYIFEGHIPPNRCFALVEGYGFYFPPFFYPKITSIKCIKTPSHELYNTADQTSLERILLDSGGKYVKSIDSSIKE